MERSCEKCKCILCTIVTTYVCYENQSWADCKLNSSKVTDLFQPVDRHFYQSFCVIPTFSVTLFSIFFFTKLCIQIQNKNSSFHMNQPNCGSLLAVTIAISRIIYAPVFVSQSGWQSPWSLILTLCNNFYLNHTGNCN